jgi:undecaprenyl-diphosphatase
MGDTLTVIGVGSVAVVILLVRKWWRPALLLTTALVVEVTVFLTTANIIDRDRPPVPQLDKAPPTSSYPSGHTAAAVALYVGLALVVSGRLRRLLLRALVWAFGVLIAAGVATGRLYRAMHHPTDVTAGVLIGAASLVVAVLAVRATVTRPGESASHEAGDAAEVAG